MYLQLYPPLFSGELSLCLFGMKACSTHLTRAWFMCTIGRCDTEPGRYYLCIVSALAMCSYSLNSKLHFFVRNHPVKE